MMQRVRHLFKRKKQKSRPNKTDQKKMTTEEYFKKFIPPKLQDLPPINQIEIIDISLDNQIEIIDISLDITPSTSPDITPKIKSLDKLSRGVSQNNITNPKKSDIIPEDEYEEKYVRIGRKMRLVRIKKKIEKEYLN